MSKFVHGLVHVVCIAINVVTLSTSLIPSKYQVLVAAVVSTAQAAVALYNHKSA